MLNPYGNFSIRVKNNKTKKVRTTPLQSNMILNSYFSLKASAAHGNNTVYLRAGTGATAPQATDLTLENMVDGYLYTEPGFSKATVNTVRSGNLFKKEYTVELSGNIGGIQGNISEIGLSYERNSQLFTRALIKDSNGNPTTISLGENDSLTVIYTIGVEVDVTQIKSHLLDIDGVSTNVSLRWVDYDREDNSHSFWSEDLKHESLLPFYRMSFLRPFSGGSASFGDFTAGVTFLGSAKLCQSSYPNRIADGSKVGVALISNLTFGEGEYLGVWNGAIFSFGASCGTMAITFDPPIVKAPTDVFTLNEVIMGISRSVP